MSILGDLWLRVKAAIEGGASTIEATLTELEQKFLPSFDALLKQALATIGHQGLQIIQDGFSEIVAAIKSGGNVGAVISALVPKATSHVEELLKQDAINAAHGVISLLIATLPTADAIAASSEPVTVDAPAVTATPTPAEAPAINGSTPPAA